MSGQGEIGAVHFLYIGAVVLGVVNDPSGRNVNLIGNAGAAAGVVVVGIFLWRRVLAVGRNEVEETRRQLLESAAEIRYDYALVAKFTAAHAKRPVILICGQTSISNRAAIDFLQREYLSLAKTLASLDRFCLVLKISAVDGYSYQAAQLAADVTTAAFAAHQAAPASVGNSSQS